jgi:hypothetical protein
MNRRPRSLVRVAAVRGLIAAAIGAALVVAAPVVLPADAHVKTAPAGADPVSAGGPLPRPDHVVVVMMENKGYRRIAGNPRAPYINFLGRTGALFARSYAVQHPSIGNYLALFSGSTHGITKLVCPLTLNQPNLGRQLIDSGRSFVGYSEDLPSVGYLGCGSGRYARKHAPWTNFPNVPASSNRPFSLFPSNYSLLPTVAFVTPNLCSDMHDCSVRTGDNWLRTHLGGYVTWARTHNSLLILSFDEGGGSNQIYTVIVGQHAAPGKYYRHITHYSVLHTIEAMYGLPALRHAAHAPAITNVWE